MLALPAAVAYSRYSSTFSLLDAAWLIPLAAVASLAALLRLRGPARRVSLHAAGGARAARWLAVAGICLTVAAAIAVGFYELLVKLEG